MRISSISTATPEASLDNSAVLEIIRNRAAEIGLSHNEQVSLEHRIRDMLRRAGSSQRFLASPPRRGGAIELIRQTASEALNDAGLEPPQLDLILYCSVARGWLEPSSAAAVQAAIGATRASCFDVLEACAGWMRALEVANAFLRVGKYRKILIVGAEMGLHDAIFPPETGTTVKTEHLAGFTLGEAATAVVVEEGPDEPEIEIRSNGDLYDACMVPLRGVEAFLPDNGKAAPERGRFMSQLDRLFATIMTSGLDLFQTHFSPERVNEIDFFVPHAASAKAGEMVRKKLDIPQTKWLCGHSRFGNTISMSMPMALHHGIRMGRVKRGSRVCFLIGSAGVSYGYGIITY